MGMTDKERKEEELFIAELKQIRLEKFIEDFKKEFSQNSKGEKQ